VSQDRQKFGRTLTFQFDSIADGSISGIEAPCGEDTQNQTLFSYVRTDDRIPSNHPLRLIRQIVLAAPPLSRRLVRKPS
jgi:hypothetical protein